MMKESLTVLQLDYAGKRSKTVRVYVPAHEEGESLPVVYMTDGQNLFESDENAFGCWYTREAVAAERESTGKAAVIVGIHNDGSPKERTDELTPASIGPLIGPQEIISQLAPEGEVFDDFVVNTVMPAVEERFPVLRGRNATAFCGSSSGGLQTFFTALSHPEKFCAAGVFSPCFMVYPPQALKEWICGRIREKMPYLCLYSGGGDELEQLICQFTESTYEMLLECYPPEQMNEVILPEQKHHEEAWEPIFRDFLHTFLVRRESL